MKLNIKNKDNMTNNLKYLCNFVDTYIDKYIDEIVTGEDISYNELFDIPECFNTIEECLQISKEEIDLSEEVLNEQLTTILSFRYKGRLCELYEILTSDKDYLGVRLMPVI